MTEPRRVLVVGAGTSRGVRRAGGAPANAILASNSSSIVILREKVERGELGRKTGRGLYDYGGSG